MVHPVEKISNYNIYKYRTYKICVYIQNQLIPVINFT